MEVNIEKLQKDFEDYKKKHDDDLKKMKDENDKNIEALNDAHKKKEETLQKQVLGYELSKGKDIDTEDDETGEDKIVDFSELVDRLPKGDL